MRILARFGLGLCGVVLGVGSAARADDAPAPPDVAAALKAQAPGHHHKGLFGWRHCVECQRAWAKKHDGVDVPPPPRTCRRAWSPARWFMITARRRAARLARRAPWSPGR